MRTRVGLPSPDGPEARLSLILLCEPDSLPESERNKKTKKKKSNPIEKFATDVVSNSEDFSARKPRTEEP